MHGAVADPVPPDYSRRLNLLVDTGATKCAVRGDARSRGAASARVAHPARPHRADVDRHRGRRIALVPAIQVEAANGRLREDDIDVGLTRAILAEVLARATGDDHGLIGYRSSNDSGSRWTISTG